MKHSGLVGDRRTGLSGGLTRWLSLLQRVLRIRGVWVSSNCGDSVRDGLGGMFCKVRHIAR